MPPLNELGSNSKARQPDPSSTNSHLNGSPDHTVPSGARVGDTALEAILAETFAIGAAILRMKIPYIGAMHSYLANGSFTVTWVRV